MRKLRSLGTSGRMSFFECVLGNRILCGSWNPTWILTRGGSGGMAKRTVDDKVKGVVAFN